MHHAGTVDRTRTIGLLVAAVATLLWLLFLVAVLTGDPADGANIGAGLAALLALPVSVGASITLLLSLRSRRPTAGGTLVAPHRASERAAAVLAVLSVACLVAFLVIDPYDSDVVLRAMLAVGLGAFLLSSGTFALTARTAGRRDGTARGGHATG